MNRVILFIDGFNLYHAIMDVPGYRKYKWLNFHQLGKSLISSKQELVDVFFFTAYYPGDQAKRTRHQTFVRAQELMGVKTIFGKFRRKDKHCKKCGLISTGFEEKETDVNIAIELFRQANKDRYDTALILSGDSDLLPAIRAVKETFPSKNIRVVLPPHRTAEQLKKEAHSYMQLKEYHLSTNQFVTPLTISGVTLNKPVEW